MNITTLNVEPLNRASLNIIGEIRLKKPSSGGGGSGDIPNGYEEFLVDEGAFLVDEGAFLVLK